MKLALGTCFHALGLLFLVEASDAADRRAEAVYEHIVGRLALMKSLAAWKRASGIAVEDLKREALVLAQAREDAIAAGLAVETVVPFFRAQIEAAKEIQRCWLARWKSGKAPVPKTAPDLVIEIRPRLLHIGESLLGSVEVALTAGIRFGKEDMPTFAARLDVDCLSPAAQNRIQRRLADLRLAD